MLQECLYVKKTDEGFPLIPWVPLCNIIFKLKFFLALRVSQCEKNMKVPFDPLGPTLQYNI